MTRCTFVVALLLTASHVQGQAPAYRVYPYPIESPVHTTPLPPADARALVLGPADPVASPFGWHDTDGVAGAEYTITRGNNAHAFVGDFEPTEPEPDGGPSLTFDFPIDFDQPPFASRAAVLTNLFYWTNVVHDVMVAYGFHAPAGNFQVNNYGQGGLGNDDIRIALRSTGSNATFMTPPDGQRPRLQLGLDGTWQVPYLAMNNWITVHQIAHGVSNRLTGGPTTVACLGNAEQMGEGWSDWYGLMFTQRTQHTRTTPRAPMGGVRPAPYSTDFGVNDYTYGDTPTMSVPNGVGFVWATIVWEVTWDLIDAHGFDPDIWNTDGGSGNQLALNLTTTGLKLQACSPGFVDARDAVLAADAALYGGVHIPLLWASFARRGLGFSASQGSSASNADNVEAFDLPPIVAGEPDAATHTFALDVPAPNPTAGAVSVSFALPAAGPLRLAVYDVGGREVAVLSEGDRAAGRHVARFDVGRLAPGAYLLRMDAGGFVGVRRLVVTQ